MRRTRASSAPGWFRSCPDGRPRSRTLGSCARRRRRSRRDRSPCCSPAGCGHAQPARCLDARFRQLQEAAEVSAPRDGGLAGPGVFRQHDQVGLGTGVPLARCVRRVSRSVRQGGDPCAWRCTRGVGRPETGSQRSRARLCPVVSEKTGRRRVGRRPATRPGRGKPGRGRRSPEWAPRPCLGVCGGWRVGARRLYVRRMAWLPVRCHQRKHRRKVAWTRRRPARRCPSVERLRSGSERRPCRPCRSCGRR